MTPRCFITGEPDPRSRSAPPWAPRVFCFPHAGGSPRAFLGWQDDLGPDAEVVAVCRPGREHRAGDPPAGIEELVAEAAAAIAEVSQDGRSFLLFGHSLGALLAFEVCRRLPAGMPRHLVLSGCAGPTLVPSRRVREIATLTGREFAVAVGFFGGLPAEVIEDDDLRELVLPPVVADFRLAAGYRYRPGPALAVPATVVTGRDDPHVGPAEAGAWDAEFAAPPERRQADGGHFYFDRDPAAAIAVLRDAIAAGEHVELI